MLDAGNGVRDEQPATRLRPGMYRRHVGAPVVNVNQDWAMAADRVSGDQAVAVGGSAGRVTMKVAPLPGALST
jgi:hypothetical protein